MAAVEQTIQYKRELMAGDLITIHSSVLELKEKSIRFLHEMRKQDPDEIAATTTLVAVHLDTAVRRACALPAIVDARIRELSAS